MDVGGRSWRRTRAWRGAFERACDAASNGAGCSANGRELVAQRPPTSDHARHPVDPPHVVVAVTRHYVDYKALKQIIKAAAPGADRAATAAGTLLCEEKPAIKPTFGGN